MHPEPSVISGVGRIRVNDALFISALKNTLIVYMIKEVLNQPINFMIFFFCFTCQFMLTYSFPDSISYLPKIIRQVGPGKQCNSRSACS